SVTAPHSVQRSSPVSSSITSSLKHSGQQSSRSPSIRSSGSIVCMSERRWGGTRLPSPTISGSAEEGGNLVGQPAGEARSRLEGARTDDRGDAGGHGQAGEDRAVIAFHFSFL